MDFLVKAQLPEVAAGLGGVAWSVSHLCRSAAVVTPRRTEPALSLALLSLLLFPRKQLCCFCSLLFTYLFFFLLLGYA